MKFTNGYVLKGGSMKTPNKTILTFIILLAVFAPFIILEQLIRLPYHFIKSIKQTYQVLLFINCLGNSQK